MTVRVLVTRAAEDAERLAAPLRKAGYEVVCVPLIARRIFPRAVAQAAGRGHDGWVLTSAAAMPALAEVGARPQWIAAVGPSTARALEEAGFHVDRVPETATAADLAAALGDCTGQRVLYPRAAVPSPGTLEALRATGADLDDVVAYENVEPEGAAEALRAAWPVDVVPLLSGSAARRLAAHVPPPWPDRTRVVAIGPRTAHAARQAGLTVHAVASPHTVAGVIATVAGSGPQV